MTALEPYQKGEVAVAGVSVGAKGTDLPKLRSRVGMVFQHFELFPHMSVLKNLNLAQVKVLNRSADECVGGGVGTPPPKSSPRIVAPAKPALGL